MMVIKFDIYNSNQISHTFKKTGKIKIGWIDINSNVQTLITLSKNFNVSVFFQTFPKIYFYIFLYTVFLKKQIYSEAGNLIIW